MSIFIVIIIYFILLSVCFIFWGILKNNKLLVNLGMGLFVTLMTIVGVMYLL